GLRQAAGADLRAGRHRESLLAQLGGHPDLDTALTAARQAADALAAAADAADATRRAEDDTRRACDLAVQAAAEAGFADLEAARRAQRDAPWRATADQAIREHEASSRAVAELLADPDLDVALDPPADLAGARGPVGPRPARLRRLDRRGPRHQHAVRRRDVPGQPGPRARPG